MSTIATQATIVAPFVNCPIVGKTPAIMFAASVATPLAAAANTPQFPLDVSGLQRGWIEISGMGAGGQVRVMATGTGAAPSELGGAGSSTLVANGFYVLFSDGGIPFLALQVDNAGVTPSTFLAVVGGQRLGGGLGL